jgi:polar amino acid transport system substrate-binding protein
MPYWRSLNPMEKLRRIAVLPMAILLLAACQNGGAGSPSEGASASVAASAAGSEGEAAGPVCDSGEVDGHLARICDAGVIKVSTDPEYPPQSFLDEETNELVGFDIDVAAEIAERLGVEVEFETPSFDAVVAGGWSNRWDMSVGSVTITPQRAEILDFTQAYYYTPAQMVALTEAGYTSLEDFAGTTICVGSGTTYFSWLNGDLELPPEAGEITEPIDAEATTLDTDTDCAESWISGRRDFEGWLTALPTAVGIQDAGDIEIDLVGDPVFFEPLAVAFDAGVEDNDSLVAAVDAIIGEMHEDGTLSEMSNEWYEGIDYTVQQ